MTNFDFFILLAENLQLFILCFLVVIPICVFVSKRLTVSWFDPFRISIITCFIGYSCLLFLFFLHEITLKDFIYCISAIVIFWSTIFLLKGKIFLNVPNIKNSEKLFFNIYLIAFLFYFGLTFFSYIKLGIPLLNENSRLATYEGSGLGFIYRLNPIFMTIILFYSFYCLFKGIKKYRAVLNILLIIVIGILSGSRSSFFSIIFSFWGYTYICKGDNLSLSKYKWLFSLFIVISLISFYLKSEGDINYAIIQFFRRIIACGDVYWMAFPNEVWKDVIVKSPFLMTFHPFLGPLRLTVDSQIPIGYQLSWIVNPDLEGVLTGPVPLFPVYNLICYGYKYGILMTVFQASLLSLFFSCKKRTKNVITGVVNFLLYSLCGTFVNCLSIAMGGLFSVLFSISVLVLIIFLVQRVIK